MGNKEAFHYTYSAKEQEEIKAIRKKYVCTEEPEDKMTQLRRLDATVMQKATTISLVLGLIGTLILGSGMSLIMTQIGKLIGLPSTMTLPLGILIGMLGIVLICLAYPIYNRIVKKERERIAPEIIRLSDELLK